MAERARELLKGAYRAVEAPSKLAAKEAKQRERAEQFRALADSLVMKYTPLRNWPVGCEGLEYQTKPLLIGAPGANLTAYVVGVISDGPGLDANANDRIEHNLIIETDAESFEISVASMSDGSLSMGDEERSLPSAKDLKRGISVLEFLKSEYKKTEEVTIRAELFDKLSSSGVLEHAKEVVGDIRIVEGPHSNVAFTEGNDRWNFLVGLLSPVDDKPRRLSVFIQCGNAVEQFIYSQDGTLSISNEYGENRGSFNGPLLVDGNLNPEALNAVNETVASISGY